MNKAKLKYFVIIPQVIAKDNKTTPKALGVLLYILSNRISDINNPWKLHESEVIHHFKGDAGKKQIQSAFRELRKRGYLVKRYVRKSNGKMGGTEWFVNRKPIEYQNRKANKQLYNSKLPTTPFTTSRKRVSRVPDQSRKRPVGNVASNNHQSNKYQFNKYQGNKIHDVRLHSNSNKKSKQDNKNQHLNSQFSSLFNYLNRTFGVKSSQYTSKCLNSWLVHYNFKTIIDCSEKARKSKYEHNKVYSPLKYIGVTLYNDRIEAKQKKIRKAREIKRKNKRKKRAKKSNLNSSSNKDRLPPSLRF